MASDDALVQRVREAVREEPDISERRMFGGVAFMAGDNMFAAASGRGLLARVGPDDYADALAEPGVSPMVMRGRSMTGYVRVSADAVPTDEDLRRWLTRCLTFVRALPAKEPRTRKAPRRRS